MEATVLLYFVTEYKTGPLVGTTEEELIKAAILSAPPEIGLHAIAYELTPAGDRTSTATATYLDVEHLRWIEMEQEFGAKAFNLEVPAAASTS